MGEILMRVEGHRGGGVELTKRALRIRHGVGGKVEIKETKVDDRLSCV